MDWTLFKGTTISVEAGDDGVAIRQHRAERSSSPSRLERILPALLLQLEDMEIGFRQTDALWLIPYQQFVNVEAHGIDAFENLCQWSPLTIELESTRWLGSSEFRYTYRFHRGNSPASFERLGCFLCVNEVIYRLDSDTFSLIEAIDIFNDSAPKDRANSALLQFHKIKGLATSVGAKLDKYLGAERVLLPSKLGVDIVPEDGGRISFVPKVEGVPQESLTRAFFAEDDIESVYAVDDGSGGRIRVIFDEDQQEALRRIQKIRHLGGRSRTDVMRDPSSVFDGISGTVDFSFGPRVIGVGNFPFTVRPYLDSRAGIFDGLGSGVQRAPEYGLECRYSDGTTERIRFSSQQQVIQFRNDVVDARSRGIGTVDFQGKTICVTPDLETSLDQLLQAHHNRTAHQQEPKSNGQYVLIYTNETELEFKGSDAESDSPTQTALPVAFTGSLKAHQSVGYGWLRSNYSWSRSGCLLADDMGLGKTLQVLLFLASLIETGEISGDNATPTLPPWNPILVIAPIILIENMTWQTDMKSFFNEEGAIFEPLLVLHGSNIKRYRNPDIQGRETSIGQPALRLEELRKFRVVLTNYETVVNYQHSFSKMRWSAIVTDEAQEYKTPSTKVSHAMKALNSRFRIACTGTPVETRLFDIWNLFDFLQPGPLLGSATDFRRAYESDTDEGVGLPKLKERLKLGSPDAFLLRRNKEEVLELPPKTEHYLKCKLSDAQLSWHIDLLNRRSSNTPESHPFSILHHLMRLSQHPALVPRFEPTSAEEAIAACPKLQIVIECLKNIKARSEKALIFTRSIDMQQLLALTLEHVFGFQVHIVNGATGKDGRQGIGRSRRAVVDSFRNSSGFNVLILSPDVAGIGLTIVEANHVIHYGRWWNPAKEAQATDRVYRIGQTKPVHVYYPVATHPQGTFPTFDEKLNDLLRRRKELAADFLSPTPSEEQLQEELLDSLGVQGEKVPMQQMLTVDDLSSLTWDRFESLVALIEGKYGRKTWLSPKCGDGGIDVISHLGSQLRLIQCKHSQWTASIEQQVLEELIASCDAFQASIQMTGFTLKPVLVTNSSVPRLAKEFAFKRDIEIVSVDTFRSYLGDVKCTRAEVETVERQRYSTLSRLRSDLVADLSKAAGIGANR